MGELGARLRDAVERTEEAGARVLARTTTVSQQLGQAVEALEHQVAVTLATMMADWKRGMEAAVAHLTALLENEHPQHAVVEKADFRLKVGQLQDALAQAFEAMARHGAGGKQGGGGTAH